MLLLFLACGWTTVSLATVGSRLLGSLESGGVAEQPTSSRGGVARKLSKDVPDGVVAVIKSSLGADDDDPETKRRVQAVTRALQQPARLVGAAGNAASGMPSRVDVGTLLVFALAATQMWLEVASRAYTDDFSGFHDHEHWPGYGLVCLRCVLAVVFLAGSRVALAEAEMRDPEAARFLRQLRVVGARGSSRFPSSSSPRASSRPCRGTGTSREGASCSSQEDSSDSGTSAWRPRGSSLSARSRQSPRPPRETSSAAEASRAKSPSTDGDFKIFRRVAFGRVRADDAERRRTTPNDTRRHDARWVARRPGDF